MIKLLGVQPNGNPVRRYGGWVNTLDRIVPEGTNAVIIHAPYGKTFHKRKWIHFNAERLDPSFKNEFPVEDAIAELRDRQIDPICYVGHPNTAVRRNSEASRQMVEIATEKFCQLGISHLMVDSANIDDEYIRIVEDVCYFWNVPVVKEGIPRVGHSLWRNDIVKRIHTLFRWKKAAFQNPDLNLPFEKQWDAVPNQRWALIRGTPGEIRNVRTNSGVDVQTIEDEIKLCEDNNIIPVTWARESL